MKKGVIIVAAIIIVAIGWYLISPVFTEVELEEESPLTMKDNFDSMSSEEKAEFQEAVEQSEQGKTMSETMGEAQVLSEGEFKPRAHEVEGKALLIESDGKKILRFEDYDTINGPNLHIYLSTDLGIEDSIDLGKIKATKGNINYELDPSIDIEKYDKVLVWCVPFRVLFHYAEI